MKVILTEAQFRDFMRYKLHENDKKHTRKIRLTEEQINYIKNAAQC